MKIESADFSPKIREARVRILPDIRRTSLEYSEQLSKRFDANVYIKWECEQVTGSFKFRGALNKVRSLSPDERRRGLVSASTGNHGLAIGFASGLEDLQLLLFLPTTVSAIKKRRLIDMGVSLEFHGTSCEKTEAHARRFAEQEDRIFVSPYNDWDIVFGAGTVGLEIYEDDPDIDIVLVPVGGGGLIGGIGAFLGSSGGDMAVYGVEPETSAFMGASIAAGRLVAVEEGKTLADAVAGGIEPEAITFPLCQTFVQRFVTVRESLIVQAMILLSNHHGRMVEAAGALALAALLEAPDIYRGKTVSLVVSGGNISPERFEDITGLS